MCKRQQKKPSTQWYIPTIQICLKHPKTVRALTHHLEQECIASIPNLTLRILTASILVAQRKLSSWKRQYQYIHVVLWNNLVHIGILVEQKQCCTYGRTYVHVSSCAIFTYKACKFIYLPSRGGVHVRRLSYFAIFVLPLWK